MQSLRQDLRYCLRQLARNPLFTAMTVLTLALGIGANTAIFSVVNGVLLRPLPYAHGDELVHLGFQPPESGMRSMRFSVPTLCDLRVQTKTLVNIVEYHSMAFSLLGHGDPDRVKTAVVSWNFFDDLGVKPVIGRSFRPGDEQAGAAPVLVLTHPYWRKRFGGDPKIFGQTLRMNDRPITVIGILPPLPPFPGKDDVYMTTSSCPIRSSEAMINNRDLTLLNLFGRLRPNVRRAQAEADLSTVVDRLHQTYHDAAGEGGRQRVSVMPIRDELTYRFRPTILILLGTVGLILLLTCTNVANLMLARLISRERELVLRVAIGAGRARLVRQLLTESTFLSLLGGAVGLAVAAASVGLLRTFSGQFTPRAAEISIDPSVLAFTFVTSLLTGLAFGLAPALQATQGGLVGSLKEWGTTTAGASRHRLRNAMIVAQVAVSFALLIMAGLTVRSLLKLQRVDAGFAAERVLTMTIDLPPSKYSTPQQLTQFFSRLLARVDANPSVVTSAVASDAPLDGRPFSQTFKIEGRPVQAGRTEPQADTHLVSEHFFRALGVPLLRGRAFSIADIPTAPAVAIVNQTLARQYWPGENPVGRRIQLGPDGWSTIVGMVGDVKQGGLREEAAGGIYTPFLQSGAYSMKVFVRTRGTPALLEREIRGIVYSIDPDQPVADLQTLAEVRDDSVAPSRLTAHLLSLFALLAFAITVIGISGVMSFSVKERRKEIGIRTALGANREEMVGMVVRWGMSQVLIGLALGVVVALMITRLLLSVLFGVEPYDLATFVAMSLLLLLVTGIACLVPARRAVAIDPSVALKS